MRPHRPQYGGGRGRFGVCMIVRAYRQTHGGENLMTFPDMDVEQLVARRRELWTDMSTEHVAESRAQIRGAVIRINDELLDRRGFVWDQEDMQFMESLVERMDDVSQSIQALRRRETLRYAVAGFASDSWWVSTDDEVTS